MMVERESREATKALDVLYSAAMRLADGKRQAIGGEIMKELGAITQARRGRLHLSEGIVPPTLWTLLIGGALITVGFTYFFGLPNLRAQVTMTGALSLVVFMGLFVIVSYDHPFTGGIAIDSHPLSEVMEIFQRR